MAFEIPAHLKKEQPSSATPDGLSGLSADPASASASPSAASEHIRSLLAPLLAEDWPSLSARQVGGHRQRLELDAQATKTAVLKLIGGSYASVATQLNGSLESEARTAELKRKLIALENEVDGADKSLSLVPPLVTALQQHSSLAHRLALGQRQLALVELLETYRSTFAPLVARPAPSPLEAVGIWAACQTLLDRSEWTWGERQPVSGGSTGLAGGALGALKADLVQRLRIVRDRIEEELGALWDGLVSASWDPARQSGVVSVHRRGKGDAASAMVDVDRLVEALGELGTLEGRTKTLVDRLINDLFRPAFASAAGGSSASLPSAFARSKSADGSLALFHLAPRGHNPAGPAAAGTGQLEWQSSPTLLPAIEALLDFLSSALPSLPLPLGSTPTTSSATSSPLKRDLAVLLVPKLIPVMVSDLLAPSLRALSHPSSLPAFASGATAYAAWERTVTSGRSTELTGFADRLGPTWVRTRRSEVLARARELVGGSIEGEERDDSWLGRGERNGWASWTWERETILESPPPPPVPVTETVEQPNVHDSGAAARRPSSVNGSEGLTADDDDNWAFDDPVIAAGPSSAQQTLSPPVNTAEPIAVEDEAADDAWGFDDSPQMPTASVLPAAPASVEDDAVAEPDAWGFSGSDDESKPIVLSKAQPREAKRLGKAKTKVGGSSSTSGDFGNSPPSERQTSRSSSVTHAGGNVDSNNGVGSSSGTSRTDSPSPAPGASRKGAMKLGKKAVVPPRSDERPEGTVALDGGSMEVDEPDTSGQFTPISGAPAGPRTVVDRLRLSERVKPLFELNRAVADDVAALQNLSVDRVPAGSSVEPPSVLLRSVIPDVFSLYRALLPVAHQAAIASGPALAMQAVNDCVWLATQAESLFGSGDASAERLRQAGQRWFTDEVARRVSGVQLILDGAFGFVDVGDEQRGADSESAVADAVARVEELSAAWKPVLPLDRAFAALGLVLDGALRRILKEITDLDDITTEESQRLNEMLKLVHPLEALFTEDPGATSAVVHYVPSWLKFCYLSELLEASMADITYLFESGALIDFETDELAQLVRALFSDNSLRAKTIDKIREGHPAV